MVRWEKYKRFIMNHSYKLLFLLPTFVFGGAERTSLNLLTGIDKKKFRISLVTSRTIFQHFQHIDIEKFIDVEDVGIDVWFGSLSRFMKDIKRMADLLKLENPDLAFGMMHYPSSLLVFANQFYSIKTKVIASPRGPSIEYLRYFEQKLSRKMYLKGIFAFFCRYADGLVVASRGMREECIKDFHAFPERVKVIPNSVDFEEIRIKASEGNDLDIPTEFRIISTLGRLEKEKNFPFLLKAFAALRKKEKAKLLIIGDGTERKNLERLSQDLNIEEDILFVGYQRNPYRFIRMSDIYVHTCLFEGFANAIIEAMACGVPVVALDCNYGPRDIIRQGENGFLVPMDDERALVDAIIKLSQNQRLRDDLVRRGHERAMNFSVDDMVKNYEGFFLQVKERI
jgi:glycosyltransferase involved in cell wall biosynthesis